VVGDAQLSDNSITDRAPQPGACSRDRRNPPLGDRGKGRVDLTRVRTSYEAFFARRGPAMACDLNQWPIEEGSRDCRAGHSQAKQQPDPAPALTRSLGARGLPVLSRSPPAEPPRGRLLSTARARKRHPGPKAAHSHQHHSPTALPMAAHGELPQDRMAPAWYAVELIMRVF
jgi:hypothetical protein